MAVVLKCDEDAENTAAYAAGTPAFFNTITNKMSDPAQNTKGKILRNLAMASYQNKPHKKFLA